jgi:membrane-bound serine protease (ClpP class)
VESSPGAADGVITALTSGPVQALLIVLGLVLVFLEIQTPGFGLPGLGAIIAFSVVFGSGALLGKVGSLEIILFLLGVCLLAVEIFLIPGFGAAGISGLALIGLSLIFSMQDFVLPRFDWEWTVMGRNIMVVAVGIIAAIAGIAVITLFGPRLRIFDRLTLTTAITGTAGEAAIAEEARDSGDAGGEVGGTEAAHRLTGMTGAAATTLRPSGKASINGALYQVEADGAFIEQGSPVKVTRVQGSRIIVKKA